MSKTQVSAQAFREAAAFENWMRANNPDMPLARGDENDPYDYVNAFTEIAWEAWRGAAAENTRMREQLDAARECIASQSEFTRKMGREHQGQIATLATVVDELKENEDGRCRMIATLTKSLSIRTAERDEARATIAAIRSAWHAYEEVGTAAECDVAHERVNALLGAPTRPV